MDRGSREWLPRSAPELVARTDPGTAALFAYLNGCGVTEDRSSDSMVDAADGRAGPGRGSSVHHVSKRPRDAVQLCKSMSAVDPSPLSSSAAHRDLS